MNKTGWTNYGDINPRVHGGVFIKRTDDGFEIVSIDNLHGANTDKPWYLFQHSVVTSIELLTDKALARFGDVNRLGEVSDIEPKFCQSEDVFRAGNRQEAIAEIRSRESSFPEGARLVFAGKW